MFLRKCSIVLLLLFIQQACIGGKNLWPVFLKKSKNRKVKDVEIVPPLTQRHYGKKKDWEAIRPLTLVEWNEQTSERAMHCLYPFYSYHFKPSTVRWSMFNLIQYRRTGLPDGYQVRDFSIFPIYYYRKTGSPRTSYGGVFPFVGNVQHFFGNDQFSWRLWPFFMYTINKGVYRYGFPYPFLRGQRGPNAGGFAVWPLFGHFWVKGDYDYKYKFWPLMYVRRDNLSDPIPHLKKGFLPFYTYESGRNIKSFTWIWPFFGYTDEWEPRYHETRYFWPLLVQGRGEEKYVNRWAPIYTHSIRNGKDKQWHLWPFAKTLSWNTEDLHIVQGQFLYFLIWSQKQISLKNPDAPVAEKTHIWPFVSYWKNGAGEKQVQLFSPFEPLFQHNQVIRKLYSPLFAFYRYNQWGPGAFEHRFLFGLLTAKSTPKENDLTLGPLFNFHRNKEEDKKSLQILKGLFGLHKEGKKTRLQLLWFKF